MVIIIQGFKNVYCVLNWVSCIINSSSFIKEKI